METSELTSILLNILLVLVIISIYINLNSKIGNLESYMSKEGYSRAASMSMAKKYANAYNALMPSDKQRSGVLGDGRPALTNSRGDFDASYLMGKSLGQFNIDTSKVVPDTSDLPVVTQTSIPATGPNTTEAEFQNARSHPVGVMDLTLENNFNASMIDNTTQSSVDREGFRKRRNAR